MPWLSRHARGAAVAPRWGCQVSAHADIDGVEAEVGLLRPIHERYTQIPNALLRNHGLSTDARAIICEWLSHTRKWHLNLKATAAENGIAYERARRAVRELRDGGYVHYIRLAAGKGEWVQRYAVANEPITQCGLTGCVDCAARSNAFMISATRCDQAKQGVDAGGNGSTESATRSDQGIHPVSAGGNASTISGVHIEEQIEDQRTPSPVAPKGGVTDPALFAVPEQPPAPGAKAVKAAGEDTDLAAFDEFYGIYPRHIGKAKAKRAFVTASKTTDPQVIIAGARRWAGFCEATRRQMQYIPHPTTWLNQGRWDDDLEEEAASYQANDGPRDVAAW